MNRAGVDYSVCMPIAPYVTFNDLTKVNRMDSRVIPFTSPDFSASVTEISLQVAEDAAAGARGLKLHSVI